MKIDKSTWGKSTFPKIMISLFTMVVILNLLGFVEKGSADPDLDDATQFVLLDVENEWTGTTQYRKKNSQLGEQPAAWGSPDDFQNGTMHMRLEILDKPSDLELLSMICLWQNGSEICTALRNPERMINFSKEDIYYNEYPAPGEGDDVSGSKNWSRPKGDHTGDYYFKPTDDCDQVLVQWWTRVEVVENSVAKERWRVLRHNPKNGIHSKIDFGPKVVNHIPIKYRLEIYVVADGATFNPPKHWNH